jgi:hypothetical protein
MLSRMRRKKLKASKYAGEEFSKEYAATLKQCASQRTVFEACLKLSSSPEAHSAVSKTGSELLKTQRELDGLTAQLLFDSEQEIQLLRAESKKLARENKGLLIELRRSMKIEEKKEVEEKSVTEDPPRTGNKGSVVHLLVTWGKAGLFHRSLILKILYIPRRNALADVVRYSLLSPRMINILRISTLW